MSEFGNHPFLDPRLSHAYDGPPPTAIFANPHDFANETDWYGVNLAMEIQQHEDARFAQAYAAGYFDDTLEEDSPSNEPYWPWQDSPASSYYTTPSFQSPAATRVIDSYLTQTVIPKDPTDLLTEEPPAEFEVPAPIVGIVMGTLHASEHQRLGDSNAWSELAPHLLPLTQYEINKFEGFLAELTSYWPRHHLEMTLAIDRPFSPRPFWMSVMARADTARLHCLQSPDQAAARQWLCELCRQILNDTELSEAAKARSAR